VCGVAGLADEHRRRENFSAVLNLVVMMVVEQMV
jgi:hypothetical protein